MPVVINEFEVLPASAPPAGPATPAPAEAPARKDPPEPAAVAAALHVLAVQSLRSWAH
ncbi:MAG TPA: hypothetical protein VFJ62_20610 [Usitatibacter sp.]|nr:hypothetical protein [Usitatibacter sp.]